MSYKLYTFDGVIDTGEIIHRMLIHAGQTAEHVKVKKGAEWDKLKEQTPFGSLPVLEVDGKKLSGTLAIAEYLGEKLGLAGDGDAWSRAQINSICDMVIDTVIVLSRYWSETDPELKKKKKEEILKHSIPYRLAKINKLLETNGTGHAYGSKATYADFFVHFLFRDVLPGVYDEKDQKNEAQKYPSVAKLCVSVHGHKQLKGHLDTQCSSGTKCHWH